MARGEGPSPRCPSPRTSTAPTPATAGGGGGVVRWGLSRVLDGPRCVRRRAVGGAACSGGRCAAVAGASTRGPRPGDEPVPGRGAVLFAAQSARAGARRGGRGRRQEGGSAFDGVAGLASAASPAPSAPFQGPALRLGAGMRAGGTGSLHAPGGPGAVPCPAPRTAGGPFTPPHPARARPDGSHHRPGPAAGRESGRRCRPAEGAAWRGRTGEHGAAAGRHARRRPAVPGPDRDDGRESRPPTGGGAVDAGPTRAHPAQDDPRPW